MRQWKMSMGKVKKFPRRGFTNRNKFKDMKFKKPLEPVPKDFGLTEERVRTLESPILSKIEPILSKIKWSTFWILYGAIVLLGGIIIYNATNSFILTLIALFFGWPFPLFFGMLIFILIGLPIEAIYRWLQPDYQRFKKYKKAKEEYKKKLWEWIRTQEIWWQSLDGRRFEMEIAMLFQKRGYKVQWRGKSGDEGIDLILIKNNRDKIIVQCKAYRNPVGPAAVRELYGTLIHHKGKEAWLISTSGFTSGAQKFAMNKPLRLISIKEIIREETSV